MTNPDEPRSSAPLSVTHQPPGPLPMPPAEASGDTDSGQPRSPVAPARVTAPPTPRCRTGSCVSRWRSNAPQTTDGNPPGEPGMSPPPSIASHDHETASSTIHRSGQPARARGNRGHPSPSHRGHDPSDAEAPGGPCSAPKDEETHRYIDGRRPIEERRADVHSAARRLPLLPSWPPATSRGQLRRDARPKPRIPPRALRRAKLIRRPAPPRADVRHGPRDDRRSRAHRGERFAQAWLGSEDPHRSRVPRANNVLSLESPLERSHLGVATERLTTPGEVEDQPGRRLEHVVCCYLVRRTTFPCFGDRVRG